MDFWSFLLELVILLTAALILGAIFERLKQSALLGYLLAGTILGPGALNLVHSEDAVHLVAELGVALLLFTIGLEFSFQRLRALGKAALIGGAIQMILTIIAVTMAGLAIGWDAQTAITAGALIAPSSTACVLRVLIEEGELEGLHGRLSLGILLFQDLSVIPLVVLISILGGEAQVGEMFASLGKATLAFGALVAVLLAASLYVLPRLLTVAALTRNRELPVLLAVSICLAATWGAHALGVSPALGAFVAGLMLAGSPFATQLRADVSTVRVLFVTLFFVSVGMLADLPWIAENWGRLLLFLPVMILLKGVIIWGGLRLLQPSNTNALAAAICLAQGGEFGFVLGLMAIEEGAIDQDTLNLILSAALASMFLTPPLVRAAPRLAGRAVAGLRGAGFIRHREPERARLSGEHPRGHVILVGFGPSGQCVHQNLVERGVGTVVLEMNPSTVEHARIRGIDAHLGDATHPEVLEHHGLATAVAVVIALPSPATVLQVIASVRNVSPGTPIIARVRQHRSAADIQHAGALVVDEEEEVGKVLTQRAFELFNVQSAERNSTLLEKI
ncbi:MAG: monovalent cation:H+ antiporter-2, family [Candidatus Sumerlaeota bacterium]|nr:monovalent cation:H+ antiporter-2, family [Candidatus Sumerlaeota bacterium]